MFRIRFPMKVLAVKLEYRRLLLEKIPHGYFCVRQGINKVVITYDPDDPKINSKHPRPLYVSSKTGKKYIDSINSYLKIKSEYDELLSMWRSRYVFAPPRVKFPIIQFSDPHKMNNEYFNSKQDNCGVYKSKNPTISDHGDLKSKNELIAGELLKAMDIPYKYETELHLYSTDETIDPDYLVNFYEIDRCAYVEILGMSEKIGYSMRTANKITGFSLDTYRPGREIIYIVLYDKYNFDSEYFISQVLSAFNDMIPDSALIWDSEKAAV